MIGPHERPTPAPAARPGRPDRDRHRRHARLRRRQGQGQGRAGRPRRRALRPAGAAVRRGHRRRPSAARAAGAAGHGHLRQGRRAATHRRPGRPAGRADHSFKAPTDEEREHDFLWRIRSALPERGLHRRLRPLALRGRADRPGARARPSPRRSSAATTRSTSSRRELVGAGTVDRQVHAAHLAPTSRRSGCWPGSTTRTSTGSTTPATSTSAALWPTYREAYEIALERTNTEIAPWYVIPSDKKWYRNLAVGRLLHEHPARHGPAVAGRRLRRRGAAAPTASTRRRVRVIADRRGHPLRHPAARGRQPARASSRPTTSAPTSASSAAPARASGCWSPRWSSASWPAGSGCAPRGWWRSTSTRRSPATRPTRRSRTCSTPAPGSTSAIDFLPGAFGYDGDAARPRTEVAAAVLWLDAFMRERRPHAGATPTCCSGTATCG